MDSGNPRKDARVGIQHPWPAQLGIAQTAQTTLLGVAQTAACVLAVLCLGLSARALIESGPGPGIRPASQRPVGAYNPLVSSDSEQTDTSAAPGPEGRRWLVDGFNVLHVGILRGRARGAWWQEEGRARLLERVAGFQDPGARVWIVFDGPRPAETNSPAMTSPESSGQVVFAPSADDWLLDQVRRAEDPSAITLVTADRQLADRARHRGAQVVAPRVFLDRCTFGDARAELASDEENGST